MTTQYCVSISHSYLILSSTLLTTHYLQSADCQKSHWTSHKSICQHTQSQIAATRQPGAGLPDGDLAKQLRKFTSAHQNLLNWAGFQALQLKRVPANVRSHALLVELDFAPAASSDPLRRFSLSRTTLIPREYITSRDALVADDIQRREERCRAAGGIGTLVILIQCAGISQVMPVEVDAPSTISWDSRADWEAVLRKFVAEGRTDFLPISTTAKGIYYG
jgi:hypothetical protein